MNVKKRSNCAERFLSRYNTLVEAAQAIALESGRPCDKQRVYQWRKQGYIPWSFALVVERLTNHDITLHEIIGEATRSLKG